MLWLAGQAAWAAPAATGAARHAAAASGAVPAAADLQAVVAQMSRAQKVAQLLLVTLPQRPAGGGGAGTSGAFAGGWSARYPPAGVVLFGRDLADLSTLGPRLAAVRPLEGTGQLRPFVAVDQEGGRVLRLREAIAVSPGNLSLGATRAPLLAYLVGQVTGRDLLQLGINMNLAPVLDVVQDAHQHWMVGRAFGADANLVGALGVATILGQQEQNLISVAKHFPGHGQSSQDSHYSLPVLAESRSELEQVALRPFRAAVAAGVDAIMVGHVTVPALGDSLPASLSPAVLGLLRQQLGYDGVVMVDALEMAAVARGFGVGRAAVRAVAAGADLLLVLWSEAAKADVFASLLTAADSGELPAARLDEAVLRLLRLKVRRGLFTPAAAAGAAARVPVQGTAKVLAAGAQTEPVRLHALLMQEVAAQSLTLLRNHRQVLPLQIGPRPPRLAVLAPHGALAERLAKDAGAAVIYLPEAPSRGQRREVAEQAVRLAQQADVLVAAATNGYHLDIIERALAARLQTPTVYVHLAPPSLLRPMPQAAAYLCAFGGQPVLQNAVAAALLGEAPVGGRLPVGVANAFAAGSGLDLPRL